MNSADEMCVSRSHWSNTTVSFKSNQFIDTKFYEQLNKFFYMPSIFRAVISIA